MFPVQCPVSPQSKQEEFLLRWSTGLCSLVGRRGGSDSASPRPSRASRADLMVAMAPGIAASSAAAASTSAGSSPSNSSEMS
eukprot:73157-Pyramimonas_sp.AAC.1